MSSEDTIERLEYLVKETAELIAKDSVPKDLLLQQLLLLQRKVSDAIAVLVIGPKA